MINQEMTYYPNGEIHTITYRNAKGRYHNDMGPARISYYDNGQKESEEYWVEDKKVDGHKLIQELGINPDYTLWTYDEKDMFGYHMGCCE